MATPFSETKKVYTITSTNSISPYVNRKYSHRSQSSDGNKLRAPRITQTRTGLMVPPTPMTPPVCNEKNLKNLRDILRASHQKDEFKPLNNCEQKKKVVHISENKNHSFNLNSIRRNNQTSLIDILKLADNESSQTLNEKPPSSKSRITTIERDLQESLRILKQYNESNISTTDKTSLKHSSTKPNVTEIRQNNNLTSSFEPINMESSVEYQQIDIKIMSNPPKVTSPVEFHKESINGPKIASSISSSSESILEENLNETDTLKMNFNKELNLENTKFPRKVFSELTEDPKKQDRTKFLNELMSHPGVLDSESDIHNNKWNYDELNELRMKFISLLSPETTPRSDKKSSPNTSFKMVNLKIFEFSSFFLFD